MTITAPTPTTGTVPTAQHATVELFPGRTS